MTFSKLDIYSIIILLMFIVGAVINSDISFTFAKNYDVIVKKLNHNISIRKDNILIYNGSNDTYGIQAGINSLAPGEQMFVYNGTYNITEPIRLIDNSRIVAQGNNTVFNYSQIGNKHALIMGRGSHLSNLKILGSINKLPDDFTQGIVANDNVVIENILISHMGYGIFTNNKTNVTLRNIKCEFIQSKSDWAACIHGGEKKTTNLNIDKFTIVDSNRAIELDATTRNVTAKNGFLLRIKNFNHTGHEAFTLDVHDHIGSGESINVTYQDVYVKDSYAPTTKEAEIKENSHSGDYKPDLPKNILYQNITVVNPTSPWQVGGIGITIKDSRIIDSNNSVLVLYKNSRDVLIKNTSAFVQANKFFIHANNTVIDTNIQNVSVIQNRIADDPNKTNPTMSFENINGLILKGNTITNAPAHVHAINIKGVTNVIACDNHINYTNNTHETWRSLCNTKQ